MYRPLADSTLMAMPKKKIIEYLRVAEYNHKVCSEQIENQAALCEASLKKARTDTISEIKKAMYQMCFMTDVSDGFLRWDSGLWIRYKLFEKVMEKIEGGEKA